MHTAEDYAELYQATFTPTERDNKLRDLAQSYVSRCEAYDRTVCTGPINNGEIVPVGSREIGLVNRNAYKVIEHILSLNPGFTRAEILRASARLAP